MKSKKMNTINRIGNGTRLDLLLADGELSRSQAARLIRDGRVSVNGIVVNKPSFVPNTGAKVVLYLPEAVDSGNKAEDISISILFEDEVMAVICKPAGLVVHPAPGNPTGTLVNALLFHLNSLSGIGGEKRPGIVHRLDKDTSGLMLVAKNDKAHLALSNALSEHRIAKHYLAVVSGQMKEEKGEMNGPIGRSQKDRKKMAVVPDGRAALTRWQLVRQDEQSALILVQLLTGRTHQIRVHFSHAHHPVSGDPLYGFKGMPKAPRLMLHAWSLMFEHPLTGRPMRFTAMPEACFQAPEEAELLRIISKME